ncbi:DNA-binding response regulator [Dulcicalothrix desertica PCC 7102]|uniref:DNA-binding response regulator n=1 Tax=Dulcicalothrix desertica PCC 7102 TaxID=232991 RepID=A0A433VV58_9CYAN|nr:response regulator transcription factor [Dulcicalothrix desertica]RUT09983.1 DNA-binding response regulator [Dulcicalothrix desertica PCC 7102]TWH41036.1 LuxR family two component transcriptional regulator [Dulcicalothrix desertica PCC 7102]
MFTNIAILPIKVLIVEDDLIMRLGLKQYLDSQPNIEVIGVAEHGYAAIEMSKQLQPDLIVMDVGLPRLDGIAATQEIKKILPDVRVVVLTSHKSEIEIIAALSSGADAYCIKGTTMNGLLVALAAVQEGAVYLDPQIARQVLEHLKPPSPKDSIPELSARELEILRLIVDGMSNTEIAAKLFLSPNTIKTYIKNLMKKLSVNDRVQAAVVALRNGLV